MATDLKRTEEYLDRAMRHLYGDAWDSPEWAKRYQESIYPCLLDEANLSILQGVERDVQVSRSENSICFDVPSIHGYREISTGVIDYILRKRVAGKRFIGDIKSASREMFNNSVEWGNKLDKAKRVVVSGRYYRGCAEVSIEDQGDGFDPSHVPKPSWRNMENRRKLDKRPGGWGIDVSKNVYLVSLRYNKKGNKVTLTKRLPKKPR